MTTKYKVITTTTPLTSPYLAIMALDVSNEVSAHLADGWQLAGPLVISGSFMAQPMIKHGARQPDAITIFNIAYAKAGLSAHLFNNGYGMLCEMRNQFETALADADEFERERIDHFSGLSHLRDQQCPTCDHIDDLKQR